MSDPIETNKSLWEIAALLAPTHHAWIETGTCVGESASCALSVGFHSVYSVELLAKYYNMSRERFANDSRVHLYHGRSSDCLARMLNDAKTDSVIFLDAHPCGPGTGGHDDLMKNGDSSEFAQDNVLRKELAIILQNKNSDHVLLLDDQHNANFVPHVLSLQPNYVPFYVINDGARHKVVGFASRSKLAQLL